jgi:outer membrane protein assembly factor BamB
MKYFVFLLVFYSTSIKLQSEAYNILWWFDTNDSSFGQTAFDDIDGDGKNELVFGCYRNDSCVYALNAENGTIHWKYNTSVYQEGCNDTAPLIYDVNNDGSYEVIVPSSCNPFTYCFDGKTGEVIWQANTRGSDSPPTIVNFSKDSNLDILHGEFGGYVISINATDGFVNKEIAVDTNSWIQTAPTIIDINNDNQLDFVVATWNFNDNNKIFAYSGSDFTELWQTSIDDYVYHGSSIADLDFDGNKEIIFGDYSGRLYVLNSNDGSIKWSYKTGTYVGSPVTVADINSDGKYEIVFCSGYKIICLNDIGEMIWEYEIPEYGTAFRGVVTSDILGDFFPEIIFGTSGGDLVILNSLSGESEQIIDLEAHIGKEFYINNAPVIGDFNQNGLLDVFIIGGKTDYPDFSNNYGRAYAIEFEEGDGPEWKMFQNNIYRTSAIEITNTSVENPNKINKLIVSPNPAEDYIEISINSHSVNDETVNKGLQPLGGEIEIYNLLGEKVLSMSSAGGGVPIYRDGGGQVKLDVSHLPKGVYFVKIGDYVKKFVKE